MKSFLILLALTLPVEAQHTQHAQHLQQAEVGGPGALREVGQSAFVAISERSTRLQDDPETDWSQVSIDRLRDHLVDMDLVFTGARQMIQGRKLAQLHTFWQGASDPGTGQLLGHQNLTEQGHGQGIVGVRHGAP